MTLYKLKQPKKVKENEPKQGDRRKNGNSDEIFLNGDWRTEHYKNPETGFEEWYDRDEKGNWIHYKNSEGNEGWRDENGNKISKEIFERIWEEVK